MRWIQRAARVLDGDLLQAWLYGGFTLAADLWLLSIVLGGHGIRVAIAGSWFLPWLSDARVGDARVVAAALACLASAGALAGFGLGVLGARRARHRRPNVTSAPRPVLRLVRCATTGAFYAHLVLPAAAAVDVVLHPDHALGYLFLFGS
ncbi:hypothetical protein [Kitasatospora sp. NPDC093558]|uniref:hypothetical protein n=1 Tax=Kitasatospora sp. NPDC093558 TaxID=3155201 RepID=UPI003433185A